MIRLRDVHLRLGERDVLRGVDADLGEQRIGVVGANGSGKSSLARLLNGLLVPTRGSVTVDGLDTARDGAKVRRRVGFVFSDPDAQIVMPTVAEDVAFSLRRQKLAREQVQARVAQVLGRFGLAAHADHPAHLLSGGQKQLLALAAILVTEPGVLVLDEPTTLLDLRNTRRIADLVSALPLQVVHVTHHLDLLAGYDRVLVVDDGRIAADDSPAAALEFYRRSQS
ncbi:biotin transport system ATP-binding protein [Kineococcus xinjiangensis]|uniref:Biotin transport system ATP-binding protein n=1 Tax=Kineococcus xinjiangensis TaxID=512762 RepID=A0A2S6IPM6_9ACTN|nr:ABC transporter ATP-binding protein [Kineococcus xinjiangensis]PPK96158.1 biotin transport system ATP-binding protein [Kineococcus xinjiangensis]